MKKIYEEAKAIWEHKGYSLCVLITAVCSYGFAICHPIVGIDDSAIGRYFEDGLGPIMGRFGYFLLNKVCRVAEYTPFIGDLIGVLLMVLGASVWCVLWGRVIGRRLSPVAATVFSCVMISSPMISEVFIYYLHNGVGICYLLSAIMMLYFVDAMEAKGWQRVQKLGIVLLLMWIINSFVESFTVVFLMAIIMVWILQCVFDRRRITFRMMCTQGICAGIILVVSILLRTVTIELLTYAFSLQDQIGIMNRRSVLEALGWFQSQQGFADLVMTIKKYIAMYYVNAIAYLPVRIYLAGVIALGVYSLYYLIRHRRVFPLLGVGAMQLVPLLLMLIEGHATYYRNSQYVPIYVGFAVMLLTLLLESVRMAGKKRSVIIGAWCVLMGILVYNQAHEMTQWFYVDYMKYEDAQNTMNLISYELEQNHDTSKPVVFVGNYQIPESIVEKMYVKYDSKEYEMIKGILDVLDPNLKDCFAMDYGYSLSSEAVYSVFTWGNIAFEVWDKENHDFFAMHGHGFVRIMDPEECRAIQDKHRGTMPAWPLEGSIVETEEYIVVNFG